MTRQAASPPPEPPPAKQSTRPATPWWRRCHPSLIRSPNSTILPAGQSLGATHQLPLVERHLFGENYLQAVLDVRLGGRAAELVELGQGSTGAANDLAEATELATRMVR